jgi:uracil-DNA glycosylase
MAASTLALSKVHPAWLALFPDDFAEAASILDKLNTLEKFAPSVEQVFRVFERAPESVKVVLVGQDPYPTLGDANGLAFSVDRKGNLPKSLQNLFKELQDDLGVARKDGDLTDWQSQGIFLINRVLTVPIGKAHGHKYLGWQVLTEKAIIYLAKQGAIGLLLGKSAQELAPHFKDYVAAPHPSPLSAYRGFFGSKIFSAVNEKLNVPIKW